MTRRIACVFAHPDDDTYGVGGTLALHAGEDLELVVLMTTSGESGRILDPSLATRETLGRVREAEDAAAWRALGLEPDLRFLRYADGGVAEVPREELVATYLDGLLAARPQVVVTFGPDGITGHPDHVAVGAAATEAFHAARAAGAGGFDRLLYVALRRSTIDRVDEALRVRGQEPFDPTQPFQPRGLPDETVGVVVDCSAAYDRKLEALREHRTQGELEDVPFDVWPDVLGSESFVIAFPDTDAGGPPLRDVFEGLA
ncbi:MAG TPA: PIG-L family deacetylase [Actinomycetota bacterium]